MTRNILLHIIFIACFFSIAFAFQDNEDYYDEYGLDHVIEDTETETPDNAYQTNNLDSIPSDNLVIKQRVFENLKEKYPDIVFNYNTTKNKMGWWTNFKQSIINFIQSLLNETNTKKATQITDYTIKGIAITIFLLVLFFIFKAIINKEGTWVFGKSSDKNIIPITDVATNIHGADFKTLISQAESTNNYRLAIRYYYLWLLRSLNEKELIDYDPEKTNSDYKNELETSELSKQFDYTSYLYNYIWYGEFDVDQAQFEKSKRAFTNFLKSVNA